MNKKDILFHRINQYCRNKSISKEHNEEFIKLISNSPFCIAYIQVIKDKKIHIDLYGNISTQGLIFKEVIKKKINSISCFITGELYFFMSFNDGINYPIKIYDYIKNHIIMLSPYSKTGREEIECLIPDLFIIQENNKQVFLRTLNTIIPIKDKIPIAKFRGSQTGGFYNMNSVKTNNLPRLKGIHLALEYPTLLDIKFINSYDIQNTGGQEYIDYMTNKFGNPAKFEPMYEFNKNRYLICFDGNEAPPYFRSEAIMVSGSVPLIQTNYIKYWSIFLEDGINYIKIKDDLSNLIDTVNYLNDNIEIAEEIAKNAKDLAKELLMPDFIDEYFLYVFNSITDLI